MADKIFSVADGLHDKLPSIQTAKAGRMLITTDRGEVYYEPEDKERIQINPQADWQQNDETANDYIKNRPGGYEEISENTLSETTFSGSYFNLDITLVEGDIYKVIFDGVEYISTAKESSTVFIIFLGNETYTWGGLDTGEPFCIWGNTNPCTIACDSGDHTIKIDKINLIKISEKYLDIKNTNIVNGSATGSLRTVGSAEENTSYEIGIYAFAEGRGTKSSGSYSHTEGLNTKAEVEASHAEGYGTIAKGSHSHAEGHSTTAEGNHSHAEGYNTTALNSYSHSEGNGTTAKGISSHAEGSNTIALGSNSHTEGFNTTASDVSSHAEGQETKASGGSSHAEGDHTTASGYASHAECFNTTASGAYSHAKGFSTQATAPQSYAEGYYTTASGNHSHAEGQYTETYGQASHAEGSETIASSKYQHVQGRLNLEDSSNIYADIVGNGDEDSGVKSNAYTLDWQGNGWYAGDVYVGSTSGTNRDEGSRKLATEIYANTVSANAIKGNVSGLNVIQITDKNNNLCPIEHDMGVKVRSKNLIPYPYAETTKTINGVTFTDNGDGTITANGTATADAIYSPYTVSNYFKITKGVQYTLSDLTLDQSGTLEKNYIQFKYVDDDTNIVYLVGTLNTHTFTAKYENIRFNIVIKAGQTVDNLVFKPQLELGSTATNYTPYVDLTAVKVTRCGKNLFDINGFINLTGNSTYYGINDNGELYVKQSDFRDDTVIPAFVTLEAGTYTLSSTTAITDSFKLINLTDNKVISFNNNVTFSIEKVTLLGIKCYKSDGTIMGKIQLELGTTATDYEPYIIPTEYTPTADGTVEGVTSLYPNTTLTTDTDGVYIDCEYNVDLNSTIGDINTALDSIIEMQNSLIGGN